MPKNEPTIKEVLKDKSLIKGGATEERALARRFAKGTVLRQQVEFFRGTYANLGESISTGDSLEALPRATASSSEERVDLLQRRLSSMRQMRDLYDEKYLFSLLSSEGRKGMSHEKTGDQNP